MAKLREAEKLQGQGQSIPMVCEKLGVSEPAFYRWRLKFGALQGGQGASADSLEGAEQPVGTHFCRAGAEHFDAERPATGKLLSPARRRDAVTYLERRFKVSQRRACRLAGQGRSTQRYAIVPSPFEVRLVKELYVQAQQHPRWGYQKTRRLLVKDGWPVNVNRSGRLWQAGGLRLAPRRVNRPADKAQVRTVPPRGHGRRCGRVTPVRMTSCHYAPSTDGRLRLLNAVGECTRVAVGSHVGRSIGARAVLATLERLFDEHSTPVIIQATTVRVRCRDRRELAERPGHPPR